MEPSNLASKICKSIVWIKDRDNLFNDKDQLGIQCDDIKQNIHHFNYNETVIRRKNKITICYNCISCGRQNTLSLNNVINKINKNKATCASCDSLNMFHTVRHDQCNEKEETIQTSLMQKIQQDAKDFYEMGDEFVKNYFKRYMTVSQFELLRHQLKYFQNKKYNFDDISYIPHYRTNVNYKSFDPFFYNNKTDTIEVPTNVHVECSQCAYLFHVKNIQCFRNKPSILCKKCSTDLGPTKTKYVKMKDNNEVGYKTPFQHKFLKFCIKQDIPIENGPDNIEFIHTNGNKHFTNIHYKLPTKQLFVDVVGNLEFQENYNNLRLNTLLSFCDSQSFKYIQIYPKNFMKYTRQISSTK